MTATLSRPAPRRRVRVWFGQHVIAEHTAEVEQAAQYETAMRRRFAGLKVTSDLVPDEPTTT